jgi:hypothetical protein
MNLGAIAERRRESQDTPEPRSKRPPHPSSGINPALHDQFSRIRYIVAGAYGVDFRHLCARSPDDRTQLARSVAVALARDTQSAGLNELAAHFGCRDAEEAAAHCNLVARRAERECRFRITVQFLRGACVAALGLDQPTSPIAESPV